MSLQESRPSREFHISEKTPYEYFAKPGRLEQRLFKRVTLDIIQNGRELAWPHPLNWNVFLSTISFYHSGDYMYGEKAITHAIAPRICSMAKNMEVSMGAPPIVYASGLLFTHKAQEAIDKLTQRRGEITSRQRDFLTQAQKSQVLQDLGKTAEDIEEVRRVMGEASNDFACQNFPLPERYTQAIYTILFRSYQKGNYGQNKIAGLLKEGRVEQAYKLACQ